MTTTYRTAGSSDEITTCDICGRVELAGTVRLELVDENGVVHGETFAGSTCAAQVAGRSAAVVRREARDADRDAAEAARNAAFQIKYNAEQALLDRLGLERTFANIKAIRALPEYAATVAV